MVVTKLSALSEPPIYWVTAFEGVGPPEYDDPKSWTTLILNPPEGLADTCFASKDIVICLLPNWVESSILCSIQV